MGIAFCQFAGREKEREREGEEKKKKKKGHTTLKSSSLIIPSLFFIFFLFSPVVAPRPIQFLSSYSYLHLPRFVIVLDRLLISPQPPLPSNRLQQELSLTLGLLATYWKTHQPRLFCQQSSLRTEVRDRISVEPARYARTL